MPRSRPLALAALLLTLPAAQATDPPSFTEYQVKAGFIYNFAKLVDWPEAAGAASKTLRVCIVGSDPFGAAKDIMAGKTVDERRIVVQAVAPQANLRQCQIAFLPASQAPQLGPLLAAVRDSPVLTIGDTQGFAAQGVIINFYQEQEHVRFEINVDAARRARLQISSRLLNLARITHDAGGER